jgi:signal transduction histidine kinase/CheY-like chemotaxis protein
VTTFIAVAGAVVASSVVLLTFFWRRQIRRTTAELDSLRDEIWELRAAAAQRDRAEAASEAKSRFLATVSHEIRTPLNGVIGLAQLLAMTRLNAEQASYVEAIGDSGRALAQLIDDILDFSKIEAGRLDIRAEAFSPAPLVEGVVELLAPRAFEKGLEIASFIATDACRPIVGDPARLRQILLNLVGNAIKFTEHGGIGVRVTWTSDELSFRVSDTGPGVPETAQATIFEDFAQADSSTTRRDGGAGLGLAISRRLAASMGGALVLRESSDSGAVFELTMPATCIGDAPTRSLCGKRIAIIAQTRFEAPYLAATLRASGAVVDILSPSAFGSEPGGDDPAPRHEYDAAIIDCALGEEKLRRLAVVARQTPIDRLFLLFSPLERRAYGEAALQDFDGWLVKPVRAATALARLGDITLPYATPAAKRPSRALSGLKVLVAEDNDINALILARHFDKLGARVSRARNGVEAVELATAQAFDLIVMDLFMPERDGRDATRAIRAAEEQIQRSPTPILALTASAQEEDRRAARAAGVDAFLTKPVDFVTLGATLEEIRAPALRTETPALQPAASGKAPNLPSR